MRRVCHFGSPSLPLPPLARGHALHPAAASLLPPPAPFRSYGGSPRFAAASRLRRSCRRMIRCAHDSAAFGGGRRQQVAASPSHRPRPSPGAPRLAFYHRDRRSPEATPSTLLPPHHGQPPPLRPCGAHSLRSPPTAGRLLAVVAASPSHRPSGCVESYLAHLFFLSFLRFAPPPIPFLHSSEKA